MAWYLPADATPDTAGKSGRVEDGDPPADALPNFRDQNTVELLATRVRYLYGAPNMQPTYNDDTRLYMIRNGYDLVARYSEAAAWVGMLLLWSHNTNERLRRVR